MCAMGPAELQAQLQQQSFFGSFMQAHPNLNSTANHQQQQHQLSTGLQQLHAHLLLQNQVNRIKQILNI